MAGKRMLHAKISVSDDVNRLPLEARLLFTWMIAHADDDGRLKGKSAYIKAIVVPYTDWSSNKVEQYLQLMKEVGLINHWQVNDKWFIEFPKWIEYQKIRKDRYTPSNLPSFTPNKANPLTTDGQPNDNQASAKEKKREANLMKVKTSEANRLADKSSYKKDGQTESVDDPNIYDPQNEAECAAKEVWHKWEPDNYRAFWTSYLNAARKGVPASMIYQFSSELKQDSGEKPGAVFNFKYKRYLLTKK
ncbi:hypothetical protein A2Z22_04805 [Candidatus Woesebacteria bacterium RBG_16_34_12]|uniref:Bacteriophage lambda Replication protein O N-terminal domain-containing protein n=1 Tax=Candidatus Woesebacteria bacterium RBG_16_34_12 TaxID=1802480 RepID=A0A1F7XAH3_9BACT|nr:MAG: hypothetical protein A2Z22_04805 [Candidatus Woesebacteria bacterium RBG_16_34_12]